MATFDEKEFLWEDVYTDVKALIQRKKELSTDYTQEMYDDFRKLELFRRELAKKAPEDINYDDAMRFYTTIENKYKLMPDKW